jgi:transposase
VEVYAGLDLSRKRLDFAIVDGRGGVVDEGAVTPIADGFAQLVVRHPEAVAVIESMNGARVVHDQLELAGWDVRVADAAKVKGIAPLACKTDRIDALVLARLAQRDLVPEIWLPDPRVRDERERTRFRTHLVKHRTMLKNRIHQTLIAHGVQRSMSDLFGVAGRNLLDACELPGAWHESTLVTLTLIDQLDEQIDALTGDLQRRIRAHPDLPLLVTIPGIGPVLGSTIIAELGSISRFATPTKLVGYTGLCPRVFQSGDRDRRGRLAKNGPDYLRWALIEAAQHAARTARYQPTYERIRREKGPQRGASIATITIARKLAEAIWWTLTRRQPYIAPAGASGI